LKEKVLTNFKMSKVLEYILYSLPLLYAILVAILGIVVAYFSREGLLPQAQPTMMCFNSFVISYCYMRAKNSSEVENQQRQLEIFRRIETLERDIVTRLNQMKSDQASLLQRINQVH
jgi:hypothetical protein